MKTPLITTLVGLLTCTAQAAPTTDTDTIASHRQLDDVVVTGSNQAVATSLLPYTVSVIDNRQLEATGANRLLTALSGNVPSLFVTGRNTLGFGVSNGGAGHIKMRGVGGDRASAVLMMVDGQPQYAGIYSHHIADFYGKEYVERVEVLRGPGSVLYGSNAMAGVINVITKDAHRDGIHATLTSQYGSYGTWLSSLTATARYGRFSSIVSLSHDRTEGTVDNFDFRQSGGYAKAAYEFSTNWKATADFTLTHFNGNDPIYPRLNNPESTDIYRQSITRGEASISATNTYGSTSGSVRAYYSYGSHFIDDPRHFHSTDDRLGIIVYQNIRPWSGAAMTAGFDFDSYSGAIPVSGGNTHTPGAMSTIERKRITEYSPYLTLSQSLFNDRLTVNGGLRMANSDRFDTQWVPQAGFTIEAPAQIDIKASVAMGYRNPSFRELYLYRTANPDLSPEKMLNYEISASKSFSRLISASLTLYYADGHDLIQELDNRNTNTGRFINKGIELSLRSRPLDNLWINASYSYLHTSLHNLTGAPSNQYFIGAEWHPAKRLSLCADLKGVSGLFVSEGIHRQSYALLGAKASYDVCRMLSIFVSSENITDAHYVINRGYDMPGITVMGGIKLKL